MSKTLKVLFYLAVVPLEVLVAIALVQMAVRLYRYFSQKEQP